jgi:energy-coupling factor transport system ATP-binding protein
MHIQIKTISYQYRALNGASVNALSDVSLEIDQNEILGIVGGTGSGKTTLIQHLNGLLRPTQGHIFIDGIDLHQNKGRLSAIRKEIGLVFQFPENQLFEETVWEDVAFGPRNLEISYEELNERVRRSLELVGMEMNTFKDRSPFHLSGGEQRRVAIAGVLAMEPEVLILDEPTVGLDYKSALLVENILNKYHQLGKTVIFVSHDMDLIARISQRVIVLKNGKICFDGDKSNLFYHNTLLLNADLEIPQIVRFIQRAKRMGFDLGEDLYKIEEIKSALRQYS